MSKVDLNALNPENIVAFIGDIFERCGDEEYLVNRLRWPSICCRVQQLHSARAA